MKVKLANLQKRQTDLVATMEKLAAGEMSEADEQAFSAAKDELTKVKAEIGTIESVLAEKQRIADEVKRNATAVIEPEKSETVPAQPKHFIGTLKAFRGPQAMDNAVAATHWFAAICGNQMARKWCNANGYPLFQATGQVGDVNTAGGYLVPDLLAATLISLVTDYGQFRANTTVIPMASDKLTIPRDGDDFAAYWVGETVGGTVGTNTFSGVTLSTKKLMGLGLVSTELVQDGAISIVDLLMQKIARKIAYKEDAAGFIGTGASSYGGIVGAVSALSAASFGTTGPAATDYGSSVIATGNLMSEVTIGDFLKLVGRLPVYARAGAKWYCSSVFKALVMDRLLLALGGATLTEGVNGVQGSTFLGKPVIESDLFPVTDANSQCLCLYGDLGLASKLGDRQSIIMKMSEDAYVNSTSTFETDQIAIRGTERIDIAVHDVGSTSAAGPLMGLWSLNA